MSFDVADVQCKAPEKSADNAEYKAYTETQSDSSTYFAQQRADCQKDTQKAVAKGDLPDLVLTDSKAQANDAAPAITGLVTRDQQDGKVSSVQYPDGSIKSFSYDQDGKLKQFGDKDGTWKKEGDTWNLYDKDGKNTGKSLEKGSNCEVDKKGDFIFTQADGTKTISAPDGSNVIENKDGKVTRVSKPDGDTKSFEYGANGELNKFTNKDGSSWKKEGDSWNLYDKEGKKTGASLEKGSSCEVDQKGDFIFKQKDGTKSTEAPDGSVVINRPDGKVSRVTDADGNTKNFEYGPSGELTKFSDKDGSSWRKEGDSWNLYDKNGKKTGSSLDKGTDCSVDGDGNFTVTYPNGVKEISHPDATVTLDGTHKKSKPISL